MDFSKEQMEKAAKCETVEELMALAKAEGIDITEEQAQKYFALKHIGMGELSDDELENIAGGAFKWKGSWYSSDTPHYLITTLGNHCSLFNEKQGGLAKTCLNCQGLIPGRTGWQYYCKTREAYTDPLKK